MTTSPSGPYQERGFADQCSRILNPGLRIPEGIGKETERLLRQGGHACVFARADVSLSDDVDEVAATAVREFGRIDVLFNNAGGAGEAKGDFLQVTDEEIASCVARNLNSVFYGCRAVLPYMIEGGGTIVNTASITGTRGQNGLGIYGAAKAGVINFTQYIAWEYGPQGIRANAVLPGAVDTPLLRKTLDSPGARPVGQYSLHQAPLRKLGLARDIAEAALFLASDAAGHITGQALPVDGGMTCGTFLDPERIVDFARAVVGPA
jgi:meso-butanediol dehydrogenase / (S,S)-butanediol dehydrogenase / diacetyl reductase